MIRIISGTYKGRMINIPSSKTTRPTMDKVRQAIFSIIKKYINEDTIFLDLFAGSGAMGIEAISRGVKKAYFNEKDSAVFKVIKENLNSLNIDSSLYELCLKDYRLFLKKYKDVKFDVVFLDPPYKFKVNQNIIKKMKEDDMLSSSSIIISEQDEKNKEIEGFFMKEYKYSEKYVAIYSLEEFL